MKTQEIDLSKLRTDGGTQAREEISNDTVREYAAAWEAGDDLPPIDVFYDGATYWIADGFHRFYGKRDAKKKSIECVVHSGTLRDAILFAVGANRTNGLRRTNKDKRRAVLILLEDEEWRKWTDRAMADTAGVSHTFVAEVRQNLKSLLATVANSAADMLVQPEEKRTGKDGKSYKATKPPKPAPVPRVEKDGPSFTPPDIDAEPEIGEPKSSFDVEAIEAETAKKKAKAPRVDGWGVPIQEHAAEAFEACPDFDELLTLLRKAKMLYADLAEKPGGAYLQSPGVSRNIKDRWRNDGIENAIKALEDAKPTYTVCPYEYHGAAIPESKHKHDKKCQLCHGLNWTRELGKQEKSEKVVEFIKEQFDVRS